MNWIERTMDNMDKFLAAIKFVKRPDWSDGQAPTSSSEEQEAYVNKSLERCPRCGDHIWGLIADPMNALSKLCPSCEHELRQYEKDRYRDNNQKPPLWFKDMMQLAMKKKKEEA